MTENAARSLLAAFAVLSLSSACSTGENHAVDANGGPEVTFDTYSFDERTGAPEALFEGTLHYPDDGGQIYGENHEGRLIGMVFPEGTTYLAERDVLESPGEGEIPLGSDVSLGGGYYGVPGGDDEQHEFDQYFYASAIDRESLRYNDRD